MPEPTSSVVKDFWSSADLRALAGLPRLRRWAANWVRLSLLLSVVRPYKPVGHRDAARAFRTYLPSPLDFDSTLGFPGEGPWVVFSFGSGFGCLFRAMLGFTP